MTSKTKPATARFNPFDAEFRRDPYPIYRRLREDTPVHWAMGMWIVTRYSDVQSILRDRTFSAGLIPQLVNRKTNRLSPDDTDRIERLGRKSLVFTDNPDHARLRALVNREFTAAEVTRLRPQVSAVAEQLMTRARGDGRMDVVSGFARPLPITALSDWMALPVRWRGQVGSWTRQIRFLLEPGLMQAGDVTRACAALEAFGARLADVVTERRSRPGDDLVSRLIAARTGGGDRLSDEEVVCVCIMCFVAGTETTTALIGNGLLALLGHPAQRALLRRTPDLLAGTVDEVLRYDSPLQLTKRLATGAARIGAETVQAGDQVLLCLGAANRDPQAFEAPDEFDITRRSRAHLAFGTGMHGCLGGFLARLLTEVAFEHLVLRRDAVELLGDEVDRQGAGYLVRGVTKLPVAVRRAR